MCTIALEPVRPADDPFLLAVYASGRAQEMAMVPWDEAQKAAFLQMQFEAQRQHYIAHYPTAEHLIVQYGGQPVGRLWVDRHADRIHVLDLTILPEHRNRGIGSTVLRSLRAEAAVSKLPLTIHVESFNPSRRLFERLGFAEKSESGFHVLMEWRPVHVPVPASDSP